MSKDIIPHGANKPLPSLFRQLFDDGFPALFTDDLYSLSRMMRSDIHETDSAYIVEMEAPGLKKDQLDIRLADGLLRITARQRQDGEDTQKNFIRRERRIGEVSRSFQVRDIQEDAISARYEDGILTVTLPKAQKSHPDGGRRIELN